MSSKTTVVLTPDWMRCSEAAGRMGCTPTTIRKRLRRGTIPVNWTTIEGTIHLNRAQYLAWLEGKTTKANVA
ncbi:MAG: hypothetical protein HOY76_08430 [Streptomyces sp.]|nr:hypothetical protein [Streptomyces sp.]